MKNGWKEGMEWNGSEGRKEWTDHNGMEWTVAHLYVDQVGGSENARGIWNDDIVVR